MSVSHSPGRRFTATDERRWPAISLSTGQVLVGRSSQCDIVLAHASISRRHARITGETGVVVEDLESRFGTFVNGTGVRRRELEPGDVLRFGNSPPYRFDGDRLIPDRTFTGMQIELERIGIQGDHGQWLLNDASASIGANEFVGLLGPSGAGKSLILESLGTRLTPGCGAIRFDGDHDLHEHLDLFRQQLGQVPQDDLVYPSLTVAENIHQAADLRIAATSEDTRHRRAREILEQFSLSPHADKLVSRLSGGQRKRLSVAVELLCEPRLLLLDEPTSGLDPGLQGQLMDLLRQLAHRGMTIVCSTHTLDTMNYFDKLIVVGQRGGVGTIAWTGPPGQLLDAFQVRHSADLYERLQRIEKPDSGAPGHIQRDEQNAAGDVDGSIRGSSTSIHAQATDIQTAPALGSEQLLLQCWTVARRSWLSFQRDTMALAMSALQPLVLAVLVVLSQYDRGGSTYIHFFLVVSAVWMGMTLTVREIVRERALYQRDRMAGLHPDAYLLGRTATALIPLAAQVLILYITARGLIVLTVDPEVRTIVRMDLLDTSWIRALVVLFLAGLGGLLIGLILSILASTERTAVAMLPIAILPQFMLSRVASGEAGRAWADASIFAPIAESVRHGSEIEPGITGSLLMLGSLPMVSRPATAALDLRDAGVAVTSGEWLYMMILLLVHALLAYVLFRWQEGRLSGRVDN